MNPDPASGGAANANDFADVADISDQGERVSHLQRDAVYFAHLSIYDFAARFCREALVLDAGSGSGYGSAYLAGQGAQHVWGIDASPKATAFSRYHFRQANLTFQEMSLEHIRGFPPQHFDLIFSSNTLEHVQNVVAFLTTAHRLLKPGGTLLVAVPPITDDRLQYLNLINRYHVNIWSPRQWAYVLGVYFEDIRPVAHGVVTAGADLKPEHFTLASNLTEKSFVFTPGAIDDLYRTFTLTAIFVAQKPRPESQVTAADAPLRFVDESFTRSQGYIDPDLRRRLKKYFDLPAPPYVLPAGEAGGRTRFIDKMKRVWRAFMPNRPAGY